jgi:hypothetical protein
MDTQNYKEQNGILVPDQSSESENATVESPKLNRRSREMIAAIKRRMEKKQRRKEVREAKRDRKARLKAIREKCSTTGDYSIFRVENRYLITGADL